MNWQRGEMYYIESLNEGKAGRPAIIVSNENVNNGETVQVVYLSGQASYDLPTHIDVRVNSRTCVALCEEVKTIKVSRLGDFIGKCNDSEMYMIDNALAIGLALEMYEKPDEVKVTNVLNVQDETNQGVPGEVVKLTIERDTYKEMYEELLKKIIER